MWRILFFLRPYCQSVTGVLPATGACVLAPHAEHEAVVFNTAEKRPNGQGEQISAPVPEKKRPTGQDKLAVAFVGGGGCEYNTAVNIMTTQREIDG